MKLDVKEIKIEDIHQSDYNPREISNAELTKLKNNIDEFGIVDPIIVNLKNNNIVGGHQRYKALLSQNTKKLNMITIGNIGWVFNTTDLDIKDDDAEKILNLSLNNISGEWNEGQLNKVLQELKQKNKNYKLTGFDDLDLERLKIDTEVLFEENIIGKSWDSFKKAQEENNTAPPESETPPDEELSDGDVEEYVETPEEVPDELTEEEELQQLHDGIIQEEESVMFEDTAVCPHCGGEVSIELFMTSFYDKVDGL